MTGPTAVVSALREEVAPLLGRLEGAAPLLRDRGGGTGNPPDLPVARRGRLDGVPVAVAVTGDGRRRARRGIRAVLDAVRPARLVVMGVAGALANDLGPCAMIVGREVRLDGRRFRAAAGETRRIVDATGLTAGVVVTVDDLLDTPGAKRAARDRLRGETGNVGPAVADLESAHYVAAAEERGVSWTVVRAVSDTADEGLPGFLDRCRDGGGSVRRAAVAREALRHPSAWPVLWRMRRRVARCAEELAAALPVVLELLEIPRERHR